MPAVKPVFTEHDLGPAGWRTLHELARQRRRSPKDQARALVLYALERALAGIDTELSQHKLETLLQRSEVELEPVA
jgi:hypothetical protein